MRVFSFPVLKLKLPFNTGNSEQQFEKVSDPISPDTSRCMLSSVRLVCDADEDLLCDESKRRADTWTTPTPLSRVAEKRKAGWGGEMGFTDGFEERSPGECDGEENEEVWEDIDNEQEGEGEGEEENHDV